MNDVRSEPWRSAPPWGGELGGVLEMGEHPGLGMLTLPHTQDPPARVGAYGDILTRVHLTGDLHVGATPNGGLLAPGAVFSLPS